MPILKRLSSIKSYIKQAPEAVSEKDYALYFTVITAACLAIVINTLLCVVYLTQDLRMLGAFAALGSATWVYALRVCREGKFARAIYIGAAQIMAHSIAGVALLGTDYGLQFFIWPAACLVALSPHADGRVPAVLSYACLVVFVLLYALFPSDASNIEYQSYKSLIFITAALFSAMPLVGVLMASKTVFIKDRKSLIRLANYDALTDLYNHRFFQRFLEMHLQNQHPDQDVCALVLLDIDHFKHVNDTYGHDVGDKVLVHLSHVLKKRLRASDIICRWGGEEFVIFLRECSQDDALGLLKSIQKSIKSERLFEMKSPITFSAGIVGVNNTESLEAIVKRADILLYEAKNAGRDCIKKA